MNRRWCGVAVVALVLVSSWGCGRSEKSARQQPKGPTARLRAGLERYLREAPSEPIDSKKNQAEMLAAVREIRQRKLHEGIEVLVDVYLMYDATDNRAAHAAAETLVAFGAAALPAIRAKMGSLADTRPSWTAMLRQLEGRVLKSD